MALLAAAVVLLASAGCAFFAWGKASVPALPAPVGTLPAENTTLAAAGLPAGQATGTATAAVAGRPPPGEATGSPEVTANGVVPAAPTLIAAPLFTDATAAPADATPVLSIEPADAHVSPIASATQPDAGLILVSPDVWQLDPLTMPHPHSLVVAESYAYSIDAGEVLAVPLAGGEAERIAPVDGLIGGYVVGELIALCQAEPGDALLALDKRGDLYRLDLSDRSWSIERLIDQRRSSPNPVYVDLVGDGGQVYLLDSSYSQVWLHPAPASGDAYLPGGDAPWERVGTDLDLTAGMAIATTGDVYVLLREGLGTSAGIARFSGDVPGRDAAFAASVDVSQPVALASAPGGTLALIDGDGRRLRLLAAADGSVVASWEVAADAPRLRAAFSDGERLYVSAVGAICAFPGTGVTTAVAGGQGPTERPDAEASLAAVGGLASPIAGARYLPARDSLLPGATRVYRYGIHRGLDIYDGTVGVPVPYGATVLAAADGIVIRADHGFVDMTTAESAAVLATCASLHHTPDDLLDRLRGRQVWIDHGDGLVTRYVHLSAIAPDVQVGAMVVRGQAIGSVGNSGTSEGVAGTQSGAHLHFEVLINGAYLGKWLSVPETRRALASLFG